MSWQQGIQHAALTDVGMRRKNNQDSHAVVLAGDESSWRQRGHVFMVADGMGAHAAGELASKLAADGVPHLYRKLREKFSAPEALEKSLQETNAEIHRRGQANLDFHSMGTTASVMLLVPQGAILAQIGDSRIYRLRKNNLEQLTFDHSLVWELRAAGQLPMDGDLARMVPKNVITRSLGPQPSVQVDIEGPFPLEPGDTYLICSDGLTGQIPDEELGPILANLAPDEAAQVLIDLANLRGGPDNITVIVVRIADPSLASGLQADSPIRVGVDPRPRKVHVAFWLSMVVFLLAALVFLVLKIPLAAGASLIGAAAAVLAGYVYKASGAFGGVSLHDGRRLGRAPYSSLTCSSLHDFLARLGGIVKELNIAGRKDEWPIDWPQFDNHCQQAETAARSGRDSAALGSYARAISCMMRDLRNRRPPQKSSEMATDS